MHSNHSHSTIGVRTHSMLLLLVFLIVPPLSYLCTVSYLILPSRAVLLQHIGHP